jgi:GNAT superfamily N-acetyltransferase
VTTLTIERTGADGLHANRDELLGVYAEVYEGHLSDPFFSIPRYWERLEAYASRDGFSLVMGRIDTTLVGYALGYTLPAGSRWWRGLLTPVAPKLLVEDGNRTFAVNEIMIREQWRRRGFAHAIHDALLGDRHEQRATLLVLPENIPARTAYQSWGWQKLGELRPFDDAPTYDAMLLDLKHE